MGAWGNYWDQVWSAEWAADLTQSLIATAIGLGGAYFVLVRQFRHDRVLADTQAEAEIFARTGAEAGVLFNRAAESIPSRGKDLRRALRKNRPPWLDDALAAKTLMMRVAWVSLPVQFDLAVDDMRTLWVLASRRMASEDYDTAFGEAVRIGFYPFEMKLHQFGAACLRWNGYGDVDFPRWDDYPFLVSDLPERNDTSAMSNRAQAVRPLLAEHLDFSLRLSRWSRNPHAEGAKPPWEDEGSA